MSVSVSRLNPRLLGYSIVLGGTLLVFFLAAFFLREALHTGRTVQVRFPEISTLSAGDPVSERGVTIGRVRRIALENGTGMNNGSAVAEIQLFHHDFIESDARFVNFSHSLMGARMVVVLPGTSTLALDESAVQTGYFAPGLAEVLHKVRSLTERVEQLRAQTDRILADSAYVRGSLAPLFSQRRLEETLRKLHALSATLETAAASLGKNLNAAAAAGDQVRTGLRTAEPGLDRARRNIQSSLTSVLEMEARLGDAVTAAERIAAAANDSTGVGKLLGDRALYDTLVGLVENLTKVSHFLREDGLGDSMKIKPRLGK